MKTEAETGLMHLQAEELQGLLARPEGERKAWNRFTPSLEKKHGMVKTLILDFWHLEL